MPSKQKSVIVTFLEALILPIAQFCLRRAIKFQEFSEISKTAFVRAAQAQLKNQGFDESVSRLSVMTGLQRREVTRLTKFSDREQREAPGGMLMRVIGQWQIDRRFSTKSSGPRPLTFEGADSEFTKLVQSVSKDINPYTVLFELERIQAVRRQASKLELISEAYVPTSDIENSLSLLSKDSEDLLLAVEENIFVAPEVPNLHLKTQYDNICREALPKIRQWILEQGALFHEKARSYLAQFDKDLNPLLHKKTAGERVVLGTFSRITTTSTAEKNLQKEDSQS